MTAKEHAKILTDFIEASENRYSPKRDNPHIAKALAIAAEVYEDERKYDFTHARFLSRVAAFTFLLENLP